MLEIDHEKCTSCGKCFEVCPVNAFSRAGTDDPPTVNHDLCVQCGACVSVCPHDAIQLIIHAPTPVPVSTSPVNRTSPPSRPPHNRHWALVPRKISQWLARPAVRRVVAIGTPIALSFLKFYLERKLDRSLQSDGKSGRKGGTGYRGQRRRRGK